MLQLVWFLTKIGLLVAGALWLAARPGQVDIQWMEYEITIHFGFFLLLFFVLLLLTIGLTRFSLFFTGLPGRQKLKKTIKNNEKGMEALTLSISSATAGDYGHSQYQAERAMKLLPGSQPIPLLLQANAMRKQGNHQKAEESLKEMLSHPEGAVLAARALIKNAVEQNNVVGALSYARTAEKDYKGKDKGWLLATLYELEAKAGNWQDAENSLNKAVKAKAVEKSKAEEAFIAIRTSLAIEHQLNDDTKNAVKLLKSVLKKDPAFVPAVRNLFQLYMKQGKKRAAANLIKKAWSKAPNPLFKDLWAEAGASFNKNSNDVSWLRKLTNHYPKHIESYLAHAENNIHTENYEYAKQNLELATEVDEQRRIYKLWITLTEKTGGSEASVRHRIEQMADAKTDPTWVCALTGQTYDQWNAIAEPHGSFNTIIWSSPEDIKAGIYTNDNSELFDLLTAS